MSAYVNSMDHSTESGTSSLLRSGLNISVGDTKSIVLALQALQQKIRALEQDRDFHQTQYDRALQAHEAYKLDMERQSEKERADHRRREQDLMDLLRKAREERAKLEAASAGGAGPDDLNAFRAELEKMIEEEKAQSEQREGKLRGEIDRLRRSVDEERTKHAALMVALEKLRAEREAAYDTNDELHDALADLERLRRQAAGSSSSAAQQSRGRGGRGGAAPSAASTRGRRGVSPAKSPSAHSRLGGGSLSYYGGRNYRDPTCNSRLRDIRHAEGEVSCSCDGAVPSDMPQLAGAAQRSGNSSAIRARPAGSRTTSAHQTPQQQRRRGVDNDEGMDPTPIAQVERQLRDELSDLQREYRNTISRAGSENLPRHVVNTALERISELIDKKEEQLRLMRAARREVSGASATYGSGGDGGCRSANVAADKATQRAMLVNELRSLLADTDGL